MLGNQKKPLPVNFSFTYYKFSFLKISNNSEVKFVSSSVRVMIMNFWVIYTFKMQSEYVE